MSQSEVEALRSLVERHRHTASQRSLAKLAEAYDEYLLERDAVDIEAWHLLLGIFQDATFLSRPGIEHFLMEMNVDLLKYSGEQLQEFLGLLPKSISMMTRDLSRHAAGDFIARAYPPQIAFRSLKALSVMGAREKHAALVGLDVLTRKGEGTRNPEIQDLHAALIASRDKWKHDL
jgi:hypothetical protein